MICNELIKDPVEGKRHFFGVHDPGVKRRMKGTQTREANDARKERSFTETKQEWQF